MANKITLLLILSISSICVFGQEVPDSTALSRELALNIYIDCNYCDQQYFKENFTIVNYVRDRKESDVHIIITEMETGGGGTEFSLQFIGHNEYGHLIDTIVYSLPTDYTDEEERSSLLKHIKWGLVPYILKTKFADKMTLAINSDMETIEEKDPWKNWVFEISADGWGSASTTYKDIGVYSGINIQKVTPDIKIETNIHSSYRESKVRYYEDDSLVYAKDTYQRSYRFGNLITKSIGDHFGIGGFFNIRSSTYNNLDIKVNLNPAVEYNVFSYSEASSKQLRFLYSVGYSYFNYIDTTIYDKTSEGLFNQELRVMFKYITDWGSLKGSISGSNYLNDFNLYSFSSYVGTEIRVFKGLSFNFWGGIDIPRDQIELRKGNITAEDVLTKQHEMETEYDIWVSVGLSYTFGSIYNNVVNPRFN